MATMAEVPQAGVDVIGYEEVGRLLDGASISSIKRWQVPGRVKLPGNSRKVMYDRRVVVQWIAARTTPADH